MYVGVILQVAEAKHHMESIPHVCGGDPKADIDFMFDGEVFPMYVGVIPQGIPSGK